MKNKGGENEWWVRRRESIRKENVSSHGIYMHRLYQRLKVNLGNFLVFRVLLTLANDICLYSFIGKCQSFIPIFWQNFYSNNLYCDLILVV